MELTLRIFTMILSSIVFAGVINLLVKRRLNESNSILWLFIAGVSLAFGFFPSLLVRLAGALGIEYAPTLLFLVAIVLLMFITFKNSIEISRASAKINEMAIIISLLNEKQRQQTEAEQSERSTPLV